jgi:flagellar biosynthesis anti-sigma factor FlgM
MRVPGSQIGSVETRTGETPVRRTAEAAATTPTGDAVVHGSRSQEVRTHAERAETERSQKLSAIKSAIDAGTYQVDFGKLADRLVNDERIRGGS